MKRLLRGKVALLNPGNRSGQLINRTEEDAVTAPSPAGGEVSSMHGRPGFPAATVQRDAGLSAFSRCDAVGRCHNRGLPVRRLPWRS